MKNLFVCLDLLVVAVLLFTTGYDRENYPTYKMGDKFKEYVLFPEGSYWVYVTFDQKVDSVYLRTQETRINNSRKIYAFDFEMFSQNLMSSFFKDELFGGSEPIRSGDTVVYLYAERYISNPIITGLQFFENDEPGFLLELGEDSEVKYVGELDSYTVEGITYENVKVFENLIQVDDRLPRKIYYARNVGVVRRELFNGQVWDLKRYFINR